MDVVRNKRLRLLALLPLGLLLGAACSDDSGVKSAMGAQIQTAYTATPLKPAMPDHQFMAAGDGTFMFVHYDKPVKDATKLLYVGAAVPGTFTKEDQARVEKQFGKGFTHFHQGNCASESAEACHGGKGGEDGFWFRHVAVDSFKMPWGDVKPGVDLAFMPTVAPR